MNEQVESCLKFLKSRFINVRREWCEACVEWIAEEQSGLPKINDLTNLVYEQWLMADLQEIALPVLPQQMSTKNGLQVYKGNFVVQMKEMIDIGHSAYSQFAKLNGDEFEEFGDHDDDDLKQFFMGKPDKPEKKGTSTSGTKRSKESTSRMLFMKLTDGHQSIDAIEYQPIKQLSIETLLPGGKIRLNGPLTCRDGLILLEKHHVEMLGGNVEEMVENASQIKLLGQILDINVSDVGAKVNNLQVGNTGSNNDNHSNHKNNDTSHNLTNEKKDDCNKQVGDVNDDILINDFFDDIEIDIDDIALSQAIDSQEHQPVLNGTSKTTAKTVQSKQPTITTKHSEASKVSTDHKKTSKPGNQDCRMGDGNVVAQPVIKEEYEDLTDDIFSDDISMLRDSTVHKPLNRLSSGPKKGVDIIEIKEEDEIEDDMGAYVEDQCKRSETACSDTNKLEDLEKYEETTLADIIACEERSGRTLGLQASFTTLTSKLVFDPCYRLAAIITDGEKFLDVILGDEVLEVLVGHSAKEVQAAAAGNLPRPQRKSIRAGLLGAEKLLEVEKWKLKMKYDESESIFHVVQMSTCTTS